jgi:segregation and condensation protein B
VSGDERTPISWEALAAELAATREADEDREDAPDEVTWDAVAAELAARVAERRPEPELPPEDAAPPQDPVPQEPERVPEPEPEPAFAVEPAALRGALEALLFVTDTPLDVETLAAALGAGEAQVRDELTALAADYDARRAGMVLRPVGEGWRLYTREEHAPVVERLLTEGQRTRLTQAALETLAVIAYRQPVTRARVSAIRGVGVDGVMRTLVTRGLVHEVGSDPDTGGRLYGTTPLFLERLGLGNLDELPPLAPLLPDPRTVDEEQLGG